jgi:protein phosphatase
MSANANSVHPTPIIQSGFRCENGATRERNEDSCLTFTAGFGGHFSLRPLGLYLVADGMGGQREGHVASNAAARTFAEYVLSHLYIPLLRQRPEPRESDLLDTLERGVFTAHDAVVGNGEALPDPGGLAADSGGTTLTAGLILGSRLYVAHVGDSRAYLLSEDELRPLTEDHSLVHRLQETGRLSAEDAQTFQYRNVLLQALGQEGALTADTFSLDLPRRGKLLLCSDGLCGLVSPQEMAAILLHDDHPQSQADQLYEAAMTAGGHDNITAIVVAFSY